MSRRARREIPVAILAVCTGNICRSPLAEQMLRLRLEGDPRFEIGSAGLHAVVGSPMDEEAAAQLRLHGGDPSTPRGEQLGDGHAAAADLILTMTRGQRDEVVRRHPETIKRVFTLAELRQLIEQVEPVGDPRSRLVRAAEIRGAVRLRSEDDVPDPIDAPTAVHAAVAAQIVELTDAIAEGLARP